MLFETKWTFRHQDLQILCPELNTYGNSHILEQTVEVVGGGSDTHLQIGENLNYWI